MTHGSPQSWSFQNRIEQDALWERVPKQPVFEFKTGRIKMAKPHDAERCDLSEHEVQEKPLSLVIFRAPPSYLYLKKPVSGLVLMKGFSGQFRSLCRHHVSNLSFSDFLYNLHTRTLAFPTILVNLVLCVCSCHSQILSQLFSSFPNAKRPRPNSALFTLRSSLYSSCRGRRCSQNLGDTRV